MQDDILGAVSLIFWTLTLIVLVKYVGLALMADDDGEGAWGERAGGRLRGVCERGGDGGEAAGPTGRLVLSCK